MNQSNKALMQTSKDQPVDEQATDIITETLDYYYGKETKHRVWRPHGIAVNKIKELIQAECNRARIDELESLAKGEIANSSLRRMQIRIDGRIAELQQLMKGVEDV